MLMSHLGSLNFGSRFPRRTGARGSNMACSTSSNATSKLSVRLWLKDSLLTPDRKRALIKSSDVGALPPNLG